MNNSVVKATLKRELWSPNDFAFEWIVTDSRYSFFFVENETHLYCPQHYEGHVMWQNTSGGHFDIQRCPTEQGGRCYF